jgi:hypothetical protein
MARQAAFVARYPELFRSVEAATRLTIGDQIGHVALEAPVAAFRFGWSNHPKVEKGANGDEVYVHLESGRVFHCSKDITVRDDVPVSPETSLFKALDGTFTLIPAFRIYPLPTHDQIPNTVLDHAGYPMHSLLADYVHRGGGWDPTFMSDQVFADVLRFAHAFTALDTAAMEASWEATARCHPARRFVELARACHPEHVLRTGWNRYSREYETCTLEEAAPTCQRASRHPCAAAVPGTCGTAMGASGTMRRRDRRKSASGRRDRTSHRNPCAAWAYRCPSRSPTGDREPARRRIGRPWCRSRNCSPKTRLTRRLSQPAPGSVADCRKESPYRQRQRSIGKPCKGQIAIVKVS